MFTALADIADHGAVFTITRRDALAAIHDAHTPSSEPAGHAVLATDTTAQARTRLNDWQHTLRLMAVSGPYPRRQCPPHVRRRQNRLVHSFCGKDLTRTDSAGTHQHHYLKLEETGQQTMRGTTPA
ncbi:hypothetical protein HCN51_39320 [Nonomuraea sp. FMUSA5-5]|uniref:Uncharacterized protein n=1 Tax=Nonomuraea composti TaxID=2720023 RepID=A0ABX1BG10_9ACTN|nr:hypothetical protein [Nonomuraea sp. FMUSA5-5]NJP95422.1 hypothetical protein [Nonomuraea sp. FMUSA5-5]